MRKLNTVIAGACAAAVLHGAPATVTAQTTFAATNDPTTSLSIESLDGEGTLVVLTRGAGSRTSAPFSPKTVLRDPATGISYEMRGFRKTRSKDGSLEIIRAAFRRFDGPVARFDLIDPVAGQQTLYISQIGAGPIQYPNDAS